MNAQEMDDAPQNLPPAAKVEDEKPARTILPKGFKVTINEKPFSLAMNTVIEGQRADIVAAGLKPE
jgi:hypothetical protein